MFICNNHTINNLYFLSFVWNILNYHDSDIFSF